VKIFIQILIIAPLIEIKLLFHVAQKQTPARRFRKSRSRAATGMRLLGS
jgi:hypothetical protein